jgi:chemotaxis protein methyltransferase CheR
MEPSPPNETVTVSDQELESLTAAIQKRHGIDFSCYEAKSLKRRITRALHVFNLKTVHELWVRILKEHSFIYPLMDEISVGLTAMFRDPVLWRTLRTLLCNELANKEKLAIWHAGCSTGEEVFSMGIVLKEAAYPKPFSALATDISNLSIAVAMKGEYSLFKISDYERNYSEYNSSRDLGTYYTSSDQSALMDRSLISHATFAYHNLITSPFTQNFDIIFCRNVMIYFDNEAKIKLFDKFYTSLNEGGLLVIGFYDAVLPMIDSSKYEILNMDAKIFRKRR